jgi:Protein of unknown function (DUF2971)
MADTDMVPPEMRQGLDKFNQAAEQLIYSYVVPPQPPPQIIYHYTNDVGLKGILKTGKLWLTDMFDLNDPTELIHILSQVTNTLNSKTAGGPPENKCFYRQFETFLSQEVYKRCVHSFVCSFSFDGDDLGQWRAYADNGRGYALAFDTVELETAFTKNSNNSTLSITYDDAKGIEFSKQLVERMFHLISLPRGRGLADAAVSEYMSELYNLLAVNALIAGLGFKHKAYNSEGEFRFLEVHGASSPEVKYRARHYSLVKYREFDWRSSAPRALKRIVVGPAADRSAVRFATDCLSLFHDPIIPLDRSKIPYKAI